MWLRSLPITVRPTNETACRAVQTCKVKKGVDPAGRTAPWAPHTAQTEISSSVGAVRALSRLRRSDLADGFAGVPAGSSQPADVVPNKLDRVIWAAAWLARAESHRWVEQQSTRGRRCCCSGAKCSLSLLCLLAKHMHSVTQQSKHVLHRDSRLLPLVFVTAGASPCGAHRAGGWCAGACGHPCGPAR